MKAETKLIICADDPVGEIAQKLIGELCAEIGGRYGVPPSPFSFTEAAKDRTIFLVATLDGQPVGCGAIRQIDDGTAEVKRMYVSPAGRRRGIARTILAELERRASGYGYSVVRLETGVLQPEAQRLYEAHGYHRIPAFGRYAGNPTSLCYEKILRACLEIRPELNCERGGVDGETRGASIMGEICERRATKQATRPRRKAARNIFQTRSKDGGGK